MSHNHRTEEIERLNARIAALEQLLEVHEASVIRQCEELDHTMYALRRQTEDLTRSQQVLQESEERYRLLFERNPNPMWVYDSETLAFLAVNNAAIQQYAYTRDEFLSMTIKDIRPSEDIPALIERVKQVSHGYEACGMWRHRKKNGTIIDVEITSYTVTFGCRPAELILSRDVTDRKRAEEATRASEQRFQIFMNNSPAIAFMKDEDGKYLYVNEPLARSFGRPQSEWLGKYDADVWPDEIAKHLRANDVIVMAGEQVVELEESVPMPDGKLHSWLVFKFPFHDPSGKKVLAGMAIDTTDRKQLEEQLRQAQKMEAIGQLAGGVAHDFNNLLTVISGYSELLQHHLSADETLRKHAEQIKIAGDRASALTRQLLAFSRQQVLRTVVLDLNRAVTDLLQMLPRLIGEHIELNTVLDPRPTFVKTDPGQLEQVLLNLAINARDAMPGGGTLTIETANVALNEAACHRLGTISPGDYVRLIVRDTGCGMDMATQMRIFEPFFTTKDVGKGTGLGLATVYGIVTQSRGAISVNSAPGRGASFAVYFPASQAEDQPPKDGAIHTESQPGWETVLVVEDQQSVRGFVRNLLMLNGYRVLEAADGAEAMRICRQHPGEIQLVVTDLVMPGMSGRELAERITKEQPEVKMLYMSGYTDDSVVLTGGAQAGIVFLQKPFSPTTFTHKVREILNGA
ncbi:MAG TPA: PAS domain S-box protein [Nitrospiraceae bacterium]|nr:PAS domain S-box protein [Nitrospiraceae bacterium]